jgi:hypothetical protein
MALRRLHQVKVAPRYHPIAGLDKENMKLELDKGMHKKEDVAN